jgi:hypothetical protein
MEKIVPADTNYGANISEVPIGVDGENKESTVRLAEPYVITEPTLNYDAFTISAEFQAPLSDTRDVREGNYGLLVSLHTESGLIHSVTLDCQKDMFGNPYAYFSYFKQE